MIEVNLEKNKREKITHIHTPESIPGARVCVYTHTIDYIFPYACTHTHTTGPDVHTHTPDCALLSLRVDHSLTPPDIRNSAILLEML